MKPLNDLTNVEKGKLLHEWFPEEMALSIQFIAAMAETITEHQETNRKKWDNGLMTFDFWLSLAQDTQRRITKYGARLETNSTYFADQLFDGYNALFTADCLLKFTTLRKHPNKKFAQAVSLLFNE